MQKKNSLVDVRLVPKLDRGIKSTTAEGSQQQMPSQVAQQTATAAFNIKSSSAEASFTQIPPQLAAHGIVVDKMIKFCFKFVLKTFLNC